jgi:hypothetical protein
MPVDEAKKLVCIEIAQQHLAGLVKYTVFSNGYGKQSTRALTGGFCVITDAQVKELLQVFEDYETRQKVNEILKREIPELNVHA